MESCVSSVEGGNLKPRIEKREFRSGPRLQVSKRIHDLNEHFQKPASH